MRYRIYAQDGLILYSADGSMCDELYAFVEVLDDSKDYVPRRRSTKGNDI